jgi:hypothetical protein
MARVRVDRKYLQSLREAAGSDRLLSFCSFDFFPNSEELVLDNATAARDALQSAVDQVVEDHDRREQVRRQRSAQSSVV